MTAASDGGSAPSFPIQLPLNDVELAAIGTFIALWGQIDMLLLFCIGGLLRTPPESVNILLEGMTTGPRVNLFKRVAAQRLADVSVGDIARQFVVDISPLIEKRNLIVHGTWAMHADPKQNAHFPAAANSKGILQISEMENINRRVAKQLHAISAVFRHIYKIDQQQESDPG